MANDKAKLIDWENPEEMKYFFGLREKADLAENAEFNVTHERQLNTERRNVADDDATFRRYNDSVEKKESQERRARDQYFSVEGNENVKLAMVYQRSSVKGWLVHSKALTNL